MSERSEGLTNTSESSIGTSKIEGLEIWHLCREYTIVQAAMLLAGRSPTMEVENLRPEERPASYEAARHALEQALQRDPDMGHAVYLDKTTKYPGWRDPLDVQASVLWASSLKKWLSEHGIKTGFFFDEKNELPGDHRPDYMNPDHVRYSRKLAAAVQAWQAYNDHSTAANGRSPKQVLAAWLEENAVRVGLVDREGKPNSTGIQEVAKVANWKTEGGAPKTPGRAG